MKTLIIINEQHTLLDSQKRLLEKTFINFDTLEIPATGWNKSEQESIVNELINDSFTTIIFISPVPSMIKRLSFLEGLHSLKIEGIPAMEIPKTFVMTNDKREKKELPNGKIIFTVAKDGWYLA